MDTVPLKRCNLSQLCKKIYPIPTEIQSCPICGGRLLEDYKYAIQVSSNECVKIPGCACIQCDAFFTKHRRMLYKLKKHNYSKQDFVIINDFEVNVTNRHYRDYFHIETAFRQYFLYGKRDVTGYTLVYELKDENKPDYIFHFSSRVGIALLRAENENRNIVKLQDKKYIIEKTFKKNTYFNEISDDVMQVVKNKKYFDDELPNFTTETVLYIYNGNIACHERHHMEQYRAKIKSFDKPIGFFVEYCKDCNKFLMKYDDYKSYLKRFYFFPMKINNPYKFYDTNNFTDTSLLFDNGYTVRQDIGLSDGQRQGILAFMMDHGIMKKRNILNYLEQFIKINGKLESNIIALQKWEADKEFVLDYKLSECTLIEIGELKLFRRR